MDTGKVAKVAIIGDIGVGKTSLLFRFTDNSFFSVSHVTIAVDHKSRVLEFDDTQITLQVWDTAGQERFRSLTDSFFRHVNGVLLVYDVCNMTSIKGINNWVNELIHHGIGPNKVPCVLVGNKCDLTNQHSIGIAEAMSLARRFDMQHMLTSAKEDKDVFQTFELLARKMVNRMPGKDENERDFKITLNIPSGKKKKKCLC